MKTINKKNVLDNQFIKNYDKNLNINLINRKWEHKYPSYIEYDEIEEEVN